MEIGAGYASIADMQGCDHCKAVWLASFPSAERAKAAEAMQLYKEANRLLDILEAETTPLHKPATYLPKPPLTTISYDCGYPTAISTYPVCGNKCVNPKPMPATIL